MGEERESDSKRERETCLHRWILNLPKTKQWWCCGRAVFWQVGIAKWRETPALGENRKLNPAALGNVGRHGKEQLVEQRKQGPGVGSIPGGTAVCSRVKFNKFPLSMSGFAPK